MTRKFCGQVREKIVQFMLEVGVSLPEGMPVESQPTRREDGVAEFNCHWRVRGDDDSGMFASWTDRDDVIEFGLSERSEGESVNLLHATVVLDDDVAQLNVMSERYSDFNSDTSLSAPISEQSRLDEVLHLFAEHLRGE